MLGKDHIVELPRNYRVIGGPRVAGRGPAGHQSSSESTQPTAVGDVARRVLKVSTDREGSVEAAETTGNVAAELSVWADNGRGVVEVHDRYENPSRKKSIYPPEANSRGARRAKAQVKCVDRSARNASPDKQADSGRGRALITVAGLEAGAEALAIPVGGGALNVLGQDFGLRDGDHID